MRGFVSRRLSRREHMLRLDLEAIALDIDDSDAVAWLSRAATR